MGNKESQQKAVSTITNPSHKNTQYFFCFRNSLKIWLRRSTLSLAALMSMAVMKLTRKKPLTTGKERSEKFRRKNFSTRLMWTTTVKSVMKNLWASGKWSRVAVTLRKKLSRSLRKLSVVKVGAALTTCQSSTAVPRTTEHHLSPYLCNEWSKLPYQFSLKWKSVKKRIEFWWSG